MNTHNIFLLWRNKNIYLILPVIQSDTYNIFHRGLDEWVSGNFFLISPRKDVVVVLIITR